MHTAEERNKKLEEKARLSLQNVLLSLPHYAGLIESIDLQLDTRIPTAGIFLSGRLLFNPDWLEALTLHNVTFIMAHELMHLTLQTHLRGEGENAKLINIAHDIIINETLTRELQVDVPAGGLTYDMFFERHVDQREFFEVYDSSLEEVVNLLKEKGNPESIETEACWKLNDKDFLPTPEPKVVNELEQALKDALRATSKDIEGNPELGGTDVLTAAQELELFPHESSEKLASKTKTFQQRVFDAMGKQEIQQRIINATATPHSIGTSAGKHSLTYAALKTHYTPPWHWAMQQWMEATNAPRRTYARPSRRGQYKNFVHPGKERKGFTLHIVLDTSGSMTGVLPKALGVIANFCSTMGIEKAHLLQCDTEVSSDDWVEIEELNEFELKGFGGSDMSPGMLHLAEDPTVERIIVITDGYIAYPPEAMPYEVLWVITADSNYYNDNFEPTYGRVIQIEE